MQANCVLGFCFLTKIDRCLLSNTTFEILLYIFKFWEVVSAQTFFLTKNLTFNPTLVFYAIFF
jgi:hypothetical protein